MGSERSLHIALIVDSMYGGGAEKVVLTLRRALERQGHEAHVIVLQRTGHYDTGLEHRVHFLRSPPYYFGGVYAYGRQAQELRELVASLEQASGKPFDLVFANLMNSYQVAAQAGLPHTWYVVHHSFAAALEQARRRNPLQFLRMRLQNRVLAGRNLITVSRGLESEFLSSRYLRPARVRTIYNPFELDELRRRAREPEAELPAEPYLLHVGRAARQKRLDVLFEAFRQVATDLPLVMLTNHPDKVRRLAAEHGIGTRVRPVAFRQNPYPWIAGARLLVLSSDYEGFPMVLIEALACGTPVVSTDCPHGPSEILTGELARWLAPVGDSRALAERISAALAERVDVSRAAILAEVSADQIARRYAALAITHGPIARPPAPDQ